MLPRLPSCCTNSASARALRGGNPYRARAYGRAALGHLTGRQLLRRPGYEVDSLDLDWRGHQRALDLGCMMSINPDAHSTAEIDLTHWGVEMARKGGVPQDRVLNCLELSAFTQYLAERRRKAKSTARRR
jgi:DNA polymerase (family X)